jgi:membrane protein DedA with SNARE-associated domain
MNAAIGTATYAGIAIAAALEGEVGYVAAAALVGRGYLDPLKVTTAGAIGAALGDQFYFYVFRGRVSRWLDRAPAIATRGRVLAARVRRHETLTILMIRFAPGLRIALAAASAYSGVSELKFSLLNGVASLLWAAGLLALVAWVGPTYLPRFGISGWWSALIPALFVLVVFRVLSRVERSAMETTSSI